LFLFIVTLNASNDNNSDAYYAVDTTTRRSTSGFIFMMGDGIVAWCSQRQKSVALSTTEAESENH